MLQNEDVNFEDFAAAVEATEKQQVQQKSTQKGFDVPDCVSIGSRAIVRFVNGIAETALDHGKPGSGRAKLFNVGWVKDDDNKSFFLVLPAIVNNKPMYKSTMVEFIDKVLSKTYVPAVNPQPGQPKGSYKYYYESRNDFGQLQQGEMTLQQIFQKVLKSGVDPRSQYYATTRSWRGQTVYVANVIDRLDYKWHQEHKKTKLLMRNVTVTEDRIKRKEVSFHAIGTPLKEITNNYGSSLNYDVLIVPGKAPTDKFTIKNVSVFKEKNFWDDVKDLVTPEEREKKVFVDRDFTAEEKTWDVIDIDKYYRLTSSSTILKHFGKTIRNFDNMTGSNFYEALKQEADAEAKVREAEKATKEAEKSVEVASATTATQSAPQPQPQTQPVATTVQAPVVESQPVATPPEAIEPSPEAKADIDSFYDSLD